MPTRSINCNFPSPRIISELNLTQEDYKKTSTANPRIRYPNLIPTKLPSSPPTQNTALPSVPVPPNDPSTSYAPPANLTQTSNPTLTYCKNYLKSKKRNTVPEQISTERNGGDDGLCEIKRTSRALEVMKTRLVIPRVLISQFCVRNVWRAKMHC